PQQTFDLYVAMGLSKQSNLEAVSIPPVPSFPNSKCVYFSKKTEKVTEELSINYIPLLNLTGIKSIIITLYTIWRIIIWNYNYKGSEKAIILHWPYYPTMFAAFVMKFFLKTNILLIVPDLPEYTLSYNENPTVKRRIQKLLNRVRPTISDKFHGYVLLTKHMNKVINPKNKPYTVMEGLIERDNKIEN